MLIGLFGLGLFRFGFRSLLFRPTPSRTCSIQIKEIIGTSFFSTFVYIWMYLDTFSLCSYLDKLASINLEPMEYMNATVRGNAINVSIKTPLVTHFGLDIFLIMLMLLQFTLTNL
jgi:hypothetical protein